MSGPIRPFRADNPAWPLLLTAGTTHLCGCGHSTAFPRCITPAACASSCQEIRRQRAGYVWVCGCGRSQDPPWCDGSHARAG